MKSQEKIREMIRRNENYLKYMPASETTKIVTKSHIEALKWVIMSDEEFNDFLKVKNVG